MFWCRISQSQELYISIPLIKLGFESESYYNHLLYRLQFHAGTVDVIFNQNERSKTRYNVTIKASDQKQWHDS